MLKGVIGAGIMNTAAPAVVRAAPTTDTPISVSARSVRWYRVSPENASSLYLQKRREKREENNKLH